MNMPIMINTKRVCPICGEAKAEVLHTQNFTLPENVMLPTSYDVVCCSQCEFVYADTYATQNEYDNFYTTISKYEEPMIASGGGNLPWDMERLERVALDISKYVSKSSAILDIGCANGGLLAILQKRGFTNLTGLDQSAACVSYINKCHGIQAVQGGMFSEQNRYSNLLDKKFDLIILLHVLEHICDLPLALDFVDKMLKKNALLYIETPDAARYYQYPMVPFYYFDCEHINHFDLQHLNMLFNVRDYHVQWQIQKQIPVSYQMYYPAIAMLLSNEKHESDSIPAYDGSAKFSVMKHVQQSLEISTPIINQLADEHEEIIVWGTGSYTMRLLDNSRLHNCNIIAFIDNDRVKQGTVIGGRNVYGPQFLDNNNYTVLVCSVLCAHEIAEQIRNMGRVRKIVSPTELL